MNTLSIEEKVKVVACLVDGNSLRATTRSVMTSGFCLFSIA
jgi:hypothetical protein